MNVSSFSIHRDTRYHWTAWRDHQRYRLRRWAHALASAYERQTKWAHWKQTPKTKTLSTCIMTMNAEHRIRPLLEYIRTFSDEIVVGVDSKTTDGTFAACQGLADELFMIESTALTCNAGLEDLVARCHGDWVLRLDDDEYPEPHFAQLKNGLLATEHYTHYKLPRLHLASADAVENKISWIPDGYLYPDFQMRLFRNDKSLLTFPGAVGHLGIGCAGPRGRVNTVNLVHLNMAINPRFKREEKLRTYIQRLNGGWVHPVNEHALLFEDFDYRIIPYRYPDEMFRQRIIDVTTHQRNVYEAQRGSQPEPVCS